MSSSSIFVIGAEGAGTTLLWDCVVRHPDLQNMQPWPAPAARGPLPADGVILHLSLPTLRPMRWIGGWAVPTGVRVVLIRRSPLHTVFSAYRRFYQDPRPAWRNYLRATALESSWVARHDPLCVVYEDLVHNNAKVLRTVYRFLGVDPAFVPAIRITDRNNQRWGEDERFRGFVGRALGVPPPGDRRVREGVPVETLDFRCHGTRISVSDATGDGVAEALRAALPPNLDPPDNAPPVAQYTVERQVGPQGGTTYRVLSCGTPCVRARHTQRIVDWLRADIEELVAGRSRESLFVHAGVVGWRGHAIVIPGRTMSGKSRLVTELVRCGATYYSDEFAVLNPSGCVLPFARRPVLRGGTVGVDPGSRDATDALPLGLIVSTTYRAGSRWQPRAIRGVRAVLPVIDNTVLARQESPRLLQLAAKLAPRAVTLQGPRPEASEVAPRLLAYLDTVLAGAPGADPTAVADRARDVLSAPAADNK